MQDVQDLVVAQAVPVQLAGAGAAAVAAGEEQLLVTEGLDHGERRTGGGEGFEQQRQGAADARVGVRGHLVAQVVDQPDRQLQFQFPAAGLGQYPAAEPGSQEMEFEFRHLAFEAQQGAVVETGRVIQPVLVQDQGVVVRADLQQPLPVGVVARQPGAFQAEHDPGPAEGDLGDQVLEPFPVGGRGPGMPLVDVDHVDPVGAPAQRDGPAAQVVLAGGRLGVVGDLVEGGLADVEVGVAAEPRRGHLAGGIGTGHGSSAS